MNRKKSCKICLQKGKKNLTSEEVLKDIEKFLDEEDNENICEEDVNLYALYGEKKTFLHHFIST